VEFVVDKVTLGQGFPKASGFSYQFHSSKVLCPFILLLPTLVVLSIGSICTQGI
jgi:hypothetical protein